MSDPRSANTALQPTDTPVAWSPLSRTIASVLLLVFMGIVVLGPLSNPIASAHLTAPLARWIQPIHRALYLGHGYRFFAPDPGPNHIVRYRIHRQDGTVDEFHFPDRDQTWPRLMYHRWFMLSETLWDEHAFTPDPDSFRAAQRDLQNRIDQARQSVNNTRLVQRLEQEQLEMRRAYDLATERISGLVEALARELLRRHGGESIELFLQERLIPLPEDVIAGARLDDPDYLEPASKIGQFDRRELFAEEIE